jgi:hypothetical protein
METLKIKLMRKFILTPLLFILSIGFTFNLSAQDLMITGIADGPLSGGTPKVIELYVINDIADLSVYTLKRQTNDNTSWVNNLELSGSASAGDFLYIIGGDQTGFNDFFENTITPLAINEQVAQNNGNDRVGIFNESDVLVDIFGEVDVNGSGEAWDYEDGWAYRKNFEGPVATFDANDWNFSGTNQLENGTTNATCDVPFTIGQYKSGDENDIVTFVLAEQTGDATIDVDEHTVDIEVMFGTDVTTLTPTITVSTGATINPASGDGQDFTNPVTYSVTSYNGDGQEWTVTVTVAENDENDITSFTLTEETGAATINDVAHTVEIEVEYGTDVTALTPTIEVSENATIFPLSGDEVDFTNPVTYTVTAENDDAQAWTVTVTVKDNDQNDILTFVLPEQTGDAVIDAGAHTVTIEVSVNADITELTPVITFSPDATMTPTSGTELDFTAPVTYTVTAQNGDAQAWVVTVNQAAVELSENDIVDFVLAEQTGDATINTTAHTVDIEVMFGTDVTTLTPTIEVSPLASINPASNVGLDFSSDVTYTVTAEDGTEQAWTVSVTEAENDANDILTFVLAQQTGDAVINTTAHTVDIEVMFGTDVTTLSPTITVSENATVFPASEAVVDFSNPVTYTVTAQNGDAQAWTVTVTEKENDANDILTFVLAEQTGDAVINTTAHTVDIEVMFGTDVTTLTPTITVSENATISPLSGVGQDFSAPFTYSVTAQNGDTQDWTVTVTVEGNDENDILTFVLAQQTGNAVINTTAHTVDIEIMFGTDVTTLTPTITVSENATIFPLSEAVVDFTNPVTYTVTAENGDAQAWIVTVTLEESIDLALTEPTSGYTCNLTATQNVPLAFENVGETTIASGEIVNFVLDNEGTILIDEDITLTADLAPGESWAGVTTTTVDLSAIGATFYTAILTYADDMNADNDEIEGFIVHFEQNLEFADAVNDTITIESTDYPYTIVTDLTFNPDSTALVADYAWAGGETTSTLEVTASGWYYVTVTTFDCVLEDSVFVLDYNAINPFNESNFAIYPNPNSGQFMIEINLEENQDVVGMIINSKGQMIRNFKLDDVAHFTHEVNMNGVAEGLYMLRISAAGKTYTRQIIIN